MNKIGVHALTFIGDIENTSVENCLSKAAKIGYDVMAVSYTHLRPTRP